MQHYKSRSLSRLEEFLKRRPDPMGGLVVSAEIVDRKRLNPYKRHNATEIREERVSIL